MQERKEAEKWAAGGKGAKPKEDKEEKRRAELARKAENARILAEEEASAPAKVKTPPKAGAKKAAPKVVKPAGPGAIAAGGGLAASGASTPAEVDDGKPAEVEVYSATGIDNAIDLLGVVTAKMDKASVGSQAANIERHPEVRSGSTLSCTSTHMLINVPHHRGDSKPHLRPTRNVKCRRPDRMCARLSRKPRLVLMRFSIL